MTLPKVVVVIPSDTTANSLVSSGALSALMQNASVYFIANPDVTTCLPQATTFLSLKSLATSRARRLDRLFWFHSLYAYMREHGIRDEDSFKVSNLRWIMKRIHEMLAHPALSNWVRRFDSYHFAADDNVLGELKRIQPELVIAPGWAMDTYSHMVLRTAQKLEIKTVMVISHWDYFTKKGLLRVNPDKVYVWGDDMRNTAANLNGVPAGDISIVGAPQFQKYFAQLPAKPVARSRLGLNPKMRWLLFPGAGLPYDELSVLKELSDILRKYNRNDIGILYRPHPRAWKRNTREEINVDQLWNVIVDDPHQDSKQSDTHFQTIIAAIDGIISPYSTMILEGGLCGVPALCIGFADEVNPWDFSQVNVLEHIRPLFERRWVIPCVSRERLPEDFHLLVDRIDEPRIDRQIKSEVKRTVFYDDRTYSERLWENLKADFLGDSVRAQISRELSEPTT